MRRVLYLWVPHLHTAVERLLAAELAGEPVVVASGSFARGVVVDASPEAEALGAGAGQSWRHARRHAAAAVFIPYVAARYRPFTERISDLLHELTPWVETMPGSEEEFFADLGAGPPVPSLRGGVPGGAGAEEGELLALCALAAVRETLGLEARTALATGKLVARTACRVSGVQAFRRSGVQDGLSSHPPPASRVLAPSPPHPLTVPAGTERQFLRPLSLDYLWDMPLEHRRRLGPLGLRTFGQLAAVPQRLLVEQFGPVGRWYRLLAAGIDARRVKAWTPHPTVSSRLIIEEEPVDLPLLEGYLDLLARRVSQTLVATGQYARVVSLMLEMAVRRQPSAVSIENIFTDGRVPTKWVVPTADSLSRPFASRHLKAPTNLPEPLRRAGRELLVGLLRQTSGARRQPPVKTPEVLPEKLASGAWRLTSLQTLILIAGGLETRGLIQLSLFGDSERGPRLRAAIARIQDRFGEAAIVAATSVASGQRPVASNEAADTRQQRKAPQQEAPQQVKDSQTLATDHRPLATEKHGPPDQ